MKRTTVVLLLLTAGACSDDRHWLQGKWISDTSASISAKPGHDSFSKEEIELFRELYGKVRWEFEGDVYRVVWLDEEPYETTYSLRSLDGVKEELSVYHQGDYIVMQIEPTQSGFCVKTIASHQYRVPKAEQNIECFARYNQPSDATAILE